VVPGGNTESVSSAAPSVKALRFAPTAGALPSVVSITGKCRVDGSLGLRVGYFACLAA
jgi:hypothetical protein